MVSVAFKRAASAIPLYTLYCSQATDSDSVLLRGRLFLEPAVSNQAYPKLIPPTVWKIVSQHIHWPSDLLNYIRRGCNPISRHPETFPVWNPLRLGTKANVQVVLLHPQKTPAMSMRLLAGDWRASGLLAQHCSDDPHILQEA